MLPPPKPVFHHDYLGLCLCISVSISQSFRPVYYATKDEHTRRWAGAAKVIDIFETSAADAADIVNTMGVHILVDMSGYTTDHRQHLFATRPAPLQVVVVVVVLLAVVAVLVVMVVIL